MLSPRQFLLIPLLVAALGGAAASRASAQQVEAIAQTIQVLGSGPTVDAQFRIVVNNGDASAASNVFVVFADGIQVAVADVEAAGSAVSEQVTRTLDTTENPSRSFPVPVTLKFTFDGANVEVAQTLIVRLSAPAEQGR
jgi:hypothetical protein